MHKCKWLPLLLLGVLSFIVGNMWVNTIQEIIDTYVEDPIQNLIVEITVASSLTIITLFLIWFLAKSWNDKDHWFGKMVYCDTNEK
jgi:NADH:ubiquinone oxidoreductase subunit 5 (subunit L)/multisubunit Na+/H+ antiporter MnhA subunit